MLKNDLRVILSICMISYKIAHSIFQRFLKLFLETQVSGLNVHNVYLLSQCALSVLHVADLPDLKV